jgi:hypothetical protein
MGITQADGAARSLSRLEGQLETPQRVPQDRYRAGETAALFQLLESRIGVLGDQPGESNGLGKVQGRLPSPAMSFGSQ